MTKQQAFKLKNNPKYQPLNWQTAALIFEALYGLPPKDELSIDEIWDQCKTYCGDLDKVNINN